ncbi:uncharacterized protein LOC142620620 [Castanea sativa]|uniref:uncharacterized protein LOC142620620 n=1 Tax=Castanea sativa TaxID=21020 RepID=UPI003F6547DF
MNAEDSLLAREDRPKKRERQEEARQDEGALTFLGQLKGDPNKRSRDKYCWFHRDHVHDKSNCYDLKQQIDALIWQEKLQRFVNKEKTDMPQEQPTRQENEHPRPPIRDIRMIVGGTTTSCSTKKARKTYLRMVQNVQITGVVPKMARVDNPVIGFSEEDVRYLHHLHDDALVVSIRIGDYKTHRVLIDNGNSTDILYIMRIERERLVLTNAPLIGFGGTRVFPLNAITLPFMVGDYPQQITKDVKFLMVNCLLAYIAILGWPTLNSWKVVTSTYHLMIKFHTKYRVGELRGHQVAALKCYIAMLEMDDHLQAMIIEEHPMVAEPVEKLEEIHLDDSKLNQTTRIGTLASPPVPQALTTFL